jgi:hypothetical protein
MASKDSSNIMPALWPKRYWTRGAVDHFETREFPAGWVFIWELKRNLEATQIGDKVPGCALILVDRSDGSVRITGTARPIEEYVDRYEKRDPSNEDWSRLPPWGQADDQAPRSSDSARSDPS